MNDALKPVAPRRLYQQIAEQIQALIQQEHFAEGSRLPPERELAQRLGVSRPSVREALIALEIAGWVEVRMGSGVFVRAGSGGMPTLEIGDSPTELMQARAVLEGGLVPLACARASPAGVAALRQALDEMRAAVAQGRQPLDADRSFHLAIAAMTENSVLVRLVGELYNERYSPLSRRLSERSETPQVWAATLTEHEEILQAIEARDALTAQTRLRAHLLAAHSRWLASGARD